MSEQCGSQSKTPWHTLHLCTVAAVSLITVFTPTALNAQIIEGMSPPPTTAQPAPAGPPVTVHGIVRNAATGEPLPRALVRIDDEVEAGALTDGEGRFEIPGISQGPHGFSVVKPNFSSKVENGDFEGYVQHLVHVAAEMPELSLALSPLNAISGHVMLSNGEPAIGIGLTLLKLTVQDGRASWMEMDSHQTTPGGEFRFYGLEDGSYTIMTQPEFDNEKASAPACNGPAPTKVQGYPAVFYPYAADSAGAERIDLAGGQQAQANLTLTLSPFHEIQAALGKQAPGNQWQFTSILMDHNGQRLNYPLREDEKNHSVCAYLPDGAYTLTVEGTAEDNTVSIQGVSLRAMRPGNRGKTLAGLLDFTVEGQAQTQLRVPLNSGLSTPVHLRYEPAPPAPKSPATGDQHDPEGGEPDPEPLGLWAVRAGSAAPRGGMMESAERADANLYQFDMVAPGSYWIHGSANQAGTCLGSVTAGGVNLALAPWIAGTQGTGPAIEAVLRTDCAKLTLELPSTLTAGLPGEEPVLFLYLVPEFDSVQTVRQTTVVPSSGTTVSLEDLTPGAYRVYVFDTPRQLEYRNPAAMDRLSVKGQPVTLSPGGNANLTLEIPNR